MRISVACLVVHGGAGGPVLPSERTKRRRGILLGLGRGAAILRESGSALDAVVAAVKALENDPLFNAGYGSTLNIEGRVELDASVMVARAGGQRERSAGARSRLPDDRLAPRAGAVAAVSRVRNPIELARAVMERTPHVLMVARGAERLAQQLGIELCRPDDLVTERARLRWRMLMARRRPVQPGAMAPKYGTVGAVALDRHGLLAGATSTGGIAGKWAGRVGDSAVIGAGVFAGPPGAASATGDGEAIMKVALCHQAVLSLTAQTPQRAASEAIAALARTTGGKGGLILVNRRGRSGYAHNTESMQVALMDTDGSVHDFWLDGES